MSSHLPLLWIRDEDNEAMGCFHSKGWCLEGTNTRAEAEEGWEEPGEALDGSAQ